MSQRLLFLCPHVSGNVPVHAFSGSAGGNTPVRSLSQLCAVGNALLHVLLSYARVM